MKEKKPLFFKEHFWVFREDPEFPHYGNVHLTQSVEPIFGKSTSDLSPKEFIESQGIQTIDAGDCEIFNQGITGEGVKTQKLILQGTAIGGYGAIVKIGEPKLTEEKEGKVNLLTRVKGGALFLSTISSAYIGKEKKLFWKSIQRNIDDGFLYADYGLFGYYKEKLGLFHLDKNGKLSFAPWQKIPNFSEEIAAYLKDIIERDKFLSEDETKQSIILDCVGDFLSTRRVYLYSLPSGEKEIADAVQHAPLLGLFSGMPFLSSHLGKANLVTRPLFIGSQNLPYLALNTTEYIPEGNILLRNYGLSYLKACHNKRGVMDSLVIWNTRGEETALGLYCITRGEIEQFKLALQNEDFVYCVSVLRSTVPDFLYHLTPDEMNKVKMLIQAYQENETLVQAEKDFFVETRYPRFLKYLNQLELSHCNLNSENDRTLFYQEFFKNNAADDIFNHAHSAFTLLRTGEFHYPYNEDKFNTNRYYLFPVDHFPETQPKKSNMRELNATALRYYKQENYPEAIKLWQHALTLSKDFDFYSVCPNHKAWKEKCNKESRVFIGGPTSEIASDNTLTFMWNLANSYQKLGEHEDSIYFFSAYRAVAREGKVHVSPERLAQAEERLNDSYQRHLDARVTNESFVI